MATPRNSRSPRLEKRLKKKKKSRGPRGGCSADRRHMSDRVLITGGAGFIGSHFARQMLERGHEVRVLGSLSEQVHSGRARPVYLEPDVELITGDVRDATAVERALDGMDSVV